MLISKIASCKDCVNLQQGDCLTCTNEIEFKDYVETMVLDQGYTHLEAITRVQKLIPFKSIDYLVCLYLSMLPEMWYGDDELKLYAEEFVVDGNFFYSDENFCIELGGEIHIKELGGKIHG